MILPLFSFIIVAGPIGFVLVCLLIYWIANATTSSPIVCPHCGEAANEGASKCRHCCSDIENYKEQAERAENARHRSRVWLWTFVWHCVLITAAIAIDNNMGDDWTLKTWGFTYLGLYSIWKLLQFLWNRIVNGFRRKADAAKKAVMEMEQYVEERESFYNKNKNKPLPLP